MNRFEALHTLGLEENASDDDVRLSCYGIEKAVAAFDFSDSESISRRVSGLLDHAKESRTFLLNSRNKTVARKVRSYGGKRRGKLTVTPVEEKMARLHGLDQLRAVVISYLTGERSKMRSSILVLVVCIVVSFILFRMLRGAPRIVAFSVMGAVAVAGSTVLTRSLMRVRKARAHALAIDDAIAALRRELGLDPEEDAADDGSSPASLPAGAASALSATADGEATYELPDSDSDWDADLDLDADATRTPDHPTDERNA